MVELAGGRFSLALFVPALVPLFSGHIFIRNIVPFFSLWLFISRSVLHHRILHCLIIYVSFVMHRYDTVVHIISECQLTCWNFIPRDSLKLFDSQLYFEFLTLNHFIKKTWPVAITPLLWWVYTRDRQYSVPTYTPVDGRSDVLDFSCYGSASILYCGIFWSQSCSVGFWKEVYTLLCLPVHHTQYDSKDKRHAAHLHPDMLTWIWPFSIWPQLLPILFCLSSLKNRFIASCQLKSLSRLLCHRINWS